MIETPVERWRDRCIVRSFTAPAHVVVRAADEFQDKTTRPNELWQFCTTMKAGIGAEAWFCDPQAPYQKGTVENTNNRLRRYLPSSTEPTDLTNRYLKSICQILNSTPRKCPGYQTPAEVFEIKLMKIQNRLE